MNNKTITLGHIGVGGQSGIINRQSDNTGVITKECQAKKQTE